ncbi:lysis protein [Mixta intestinalis]|uniref:Lysis protein n=1 Tax=Mixta intestinalis TaxID=1615494 RepID=A0A6P1Q0D7_9GAMM|nr:lysis protein [Mixta intestinalis]QHM71295.1 hypothetical protein C7M51_01581 [Mixta intestinalis]
MNGLQKIAAVCVVAALVVALHYRHAAERQSRRADAAEQQLAQANSTISDMQRRQRAVTELDARYTQDLADAKNTIERLRNDVAAGRKRLRVAATCSAVPATATATGMDDAASARPTDAAERDYFTLRERIETAAVQIAGLQQYIREQCLKN